MRPPPSPQALLADGSDVGPRSWDYGGSRPRQTIVLCKHLAITLSDDQHELLLQIADTLTAAARTRADPVPGSSSLQQTGAAAALDGAEFRHPRPVCRCSLLSPPPPFLARRQIAHLGAGAFVPLLQAPRVRRPASRGGGFACAFAAVPSASWLSWTSDVLAAMWDQPPATMTADEEADAALRILASPDRFKPSSFTAVVLPSVVVTLTVRPGGAPGAPADGVRRAPYRS